ncbi:hypothetical protein PVAP13_3NG105250 [Panicum virgatum]|uniref:Uncharacterized protein n=1 Tax=Panicum virgatum TaxID=38727 RepID=A0A8T0U6W6_PANVG|nr:hypothetical protein PVAP13_3NG105250 [Panicum virgatum]
MGWNGKRPAQVAYPVQRFPPVSISFLNKKKTSVHIRSPTPHRAAAGGASIQIQVTFLPPRHILPPPSAERSAGLELGGVELGGLELRRAELERISAAPPTLRLLHPSPPSLSSPASHPPPLLPCSSAPACCGSVYLYYVGLAAWWGLIDLFSRVPHVV